MIETFIINILFIYGLNIVTREKMVFDKLRRFIEKTFGNFWSKPLVNCPPCMASFWGVVGMVVAVYTLQLPWYYLAYIPVYCLALAGAVFLIGQFMPCCESENDENDNNKWKPIETHRPSNDTLVICLLENGNEEYCWFTDGKFISKNTGKVFITEKITHYKHI